MTQQHSQNNLFQHKQAASLLLLNPSHGSPLSIIILFPSLPRKLLVWLHPDLLIHVTWSADLSLSSAHKPIKARECSRRQEDEAFESTCAVPLSSQPTETEENLSEHTRWSTGPHSDADFLPLWFICRCDFVACAIILKGTCVNLPERHCAQI